MYLYIKGYISFCKITIFCIHINLASDLTTQMEVTLFMLNDKIKKAFNQNYIAISIFLDFSKAFDRVNYDILLDNLNYYGIRGSALNWFANYLKNRDHILVYENSMLASLKIQSGVLQGSILGLLVFGIY